MKFSPCSVLTFAPRVDMNTVSIALDTPERKTPRCTTPAIGWIVLVRIFTSTTKKEPSHDPEPYPPPTLEELWGKLFTVDILAGHDAAPHVSWTGEQVLMLAVLHDAVKRYQEGAALLTFRGRYRTQAQNQAIEAADWFASEDDHYLYAFERICDTLHLDAGGIRRGLKVWTAQGLPPPRKRQRYSKRQGTLQHAA